MYDGCLLNSPSYTVNVIHLPDFSKARILVVGDLMLDRYWHGDTHRISPEAPVSVVKVGGIDHVGIGSDRDHRYIDLTPEYIAELKAEQGANLNEADLPWFMIELNGPRRMETIWDGLKGRGLSEDDLEKIMGANVRRLYAETIG